MLISNVLPQISAPQAANVAAAQSAFAAAAAASASKPQTPVAVSAATAAAGYSPYLTDQRRTSTATTPAPVLADPANGRPSILPDPEFWRVPDREVNKQLTQQQVQQPVRTPVETVQQTAAFVAQAAAQELPEVKLPQPEEKPAGSGLPGARKPAALIGKKPGVGDATGFGAYAVSSARTVAIDFPVLHEAVA